MNRKAGKRKERKVSMTLIIMLLFTLILTLIAYRKAPGLPLEGLKDGGRLFLGILPTMVVAFIAAGMIGQVLPREILTRWLGEESGLRGLIIATLGGSITPGGPFIQFPLVAALFKAGAGVAPIMAFITSWSLLSVNRFLIWEIPLLGWRLATARILASLIIPFAVAVLTRFIYQRL
jgi:uncharacterized membrane protein YraQ (UPF0718 family)